MLWEPALTLEEILLCAAVWCKPVKPHTWKQWILYAEHRWPVSIRHGLHNLLFGYICASILDANPCFQVVEMAAVQFKELNQQDPQVLIRVPGINTRMELRKKGGEISPVINGLMVIYLMNTQRQISVLQNKLQCTCS